MNAHIDPGEGRRDTARAWLIVLAGTVVAVVWDLNGSAEVAFAASALVLQLIEMMNTDPL